MATKVKQAKAAKTKMAPAKIIKAVKTKVSPANHQKEIESHKKAAKHHADAAKHHLEAVKHLEGGFHKLAEESKDKAQNVLSYLHKLWDDLKHRTLKN